MSNKGEQLFYDLVQDVGEIKGLMKGFIKAQEGINEDHDNRISFFEKYLKPMVLVSITVITATVYAIMDVAVEHFK